MKELLIVVDMQTDFIGGALGTREAQKILPSVKARIENARREGKEVVFTRDTHTENYLSSAEGKKLPVVHCVRGTEGWQIARELNPANAKIFDKPAFGSVELGEYVKAGAYDRVELIGVCTDICVISNAMLVKAFCPETSICVRADCCAGVTPESHANALKAMEACQIEII